ncbi:hypothetical protein [Taklimakanibacter deserti]|uniref:hypothetical protein n=1 Tax=Taklimakanibacter deserti TaxID=2267839 RepID=UPI000E65DB8F
MDFSFSNVLGLLVFSVLGLLCLWIFHRFIYPILSARYEKAKVTGTQGPDPIKVSRVIYVVSLVLFPVAGFLLGNMFLNG